MSPDGEAEAPDGAAAGLGILEVTRAPSLIRTQVAADLRRAIAEGRLKPGQVLVERQICEATTASRASVREALRELEATGLVVSVPGRGTVVAALSEVDALHCYEVRAALEGFAGWSFAIRATDAQVSNLGAVVANMRNLEGSVGELLAAKDEFYEVLFAGTGNGEFSRLLAPLQLRVTQARNASLSRAGRPAASLHELEGIVSAATERNPELTSRRCIEHVWNAASAALRKDLSERAAGHWVWDPKS